MLRQTAQLFSSAIATSNRPLIAFPTALDIDSVVSAISLGKILERKNKPFAIVSNDCSPEIIAASLHSLKNIEADATILRHFYLHPNAPHNDHDLIITLNSPELPALGDVFNVNAPLFDRAPIVNIGYGTNADRFGALNIVQPGATSSSEIIYGILREIAEHHLDEKIATYLLTGMVYKTKKFKSPEISADSISAFRLLMESGAQKNRIFEDFYRTKTPQVLKLWSSTLLKLQIDTKKQIAWATIQSKDFETAGAGSSELFNLTNELLSSIATLRVVIFYYKENEEPTALIIANDNTTILKKITAATKIRTNYFLKISKPNIDELIRNIQKNL